MIDSTLHFEHPVPPTFSLPLWKEKGSMSIYTGVTRLRTHWLNVALDQSDVNFDQEFKLCLLNDTALVRKDMLLRLTMKRILLNYNSHSKPRLNFIFFHLKKGKPRNRKLSAPSYNGWQLLDWRQESPPCSYSHHHLTTWRTNWCIAVFLKKWQFAAAARVNLFLWKLLPNLHTVSDGRWFTENLYYKNQIRCNWFFS